MPKHNCPYCDGPGGAKTYRHQVCMPLNGKVQCIDHCIHQIVAALNAGGVWTVASCCGHRGAPGRIDLADGRVLIIPRPEDLDLGEDGNLRLVAPIPHGGSDDPILGG